MISPRFVAGSLLVPVLALAPAALADAPRLEHAVAPGRLVEYDLAIETTRDRRGPGGWTQISDHQAGHLVRYILSAGDARAQRVEMLTLSAAEVVSATRDGVGISPRPSAAELRLDAGGVYMTVNQISASNAPALLPGGDDDRLVGVALLMAPPRWPSEPTTEWTSPVSVREHDLAVTWRVGGGASSSAGDTITLHGSMEESAGAEAADARAITVQSTWVWDAAAGVASTLDGTARYRIAKPQFDETYAVRVALRRRRLEDLGGPGQRDMHESILALNAAVAASRQGNRQEAERGARAFVDRWPTSPWRPIIDRLLADLSNAAAQPTAPSASTPATATQPVDLLERLSHAMQSWQEADRAADDAARGRLRTALAPLVSGSREKIRAMLKTGEPGPRAVGVFALAFTDDGLDLLALQDASGDVDGRVRAWAAYALAIRADPRTEFRTLQLLARDDDANVRARACEAVAACVPADSRDARAARSLLLERLHDDFDGVRYHAAIALMSLAEPADVPPIQAVRDAEPSEAVVGALDRLIEKLRPRK